MINNLLPQILILYVLLACSTTIIHTERSQMTIIDDGTTTTQQRDTRINYTAFLRGELVPTSYKKHPLEAYGCFYGYGYQNCTCFTPKLKPSMGCYGPMCYAIAENVQTTLQKNYSCSVTGDNLIDCTGNDSGNAYLFTNCTSGLSMRVNSSLAANLYDHEFRFDSIELNRDHKVVSCPLLRSFNTYLHGYTVKINVHVHKVPAEFDKQEWVVQVLSCTADAIEKQYMLSIGQHFVQDVVIAVS